MNACIIQGDIRTRHIDLIINEMRSHFDKVIVSTWQGEESKLPAGNYELILNSPPVNKGLSHRNFQRLSTAAGLVRAKDLGCEFILKWRTDCLPTAFDIKYLLNGANYNIPDGFSSRIVMPAFRNLSVTPDWFSSFPDHFAFGGIREMQLLWGDEGFNYNLDFNCPHQMVTHPDIKRIDGKLYYASNDYTVHYDAHIELYAIFKARLQELLDREINHPDIAKNHLYLINHKSLKICWFNKDEGFRSITQALMYPWWTEKIFLNLHPYVLIQAGYKVSPLRRFVWDALSRVITLRNRMNQSLWFRRYTTK